MDSAISSSEASITGEVAAMALPPHIAVPNIINCDNFFSILNSFARISPIIITNTRLTAVCNIPLLPTAITLFILSPKPNNTTAEFNVNFLIFPKFLGVEIK